MVFIDQALMKMRKENRKVCMCVCIGGREGAAIADASRLSSSLQSK